MTHIWPVIVCYPSFKWVCPHLVKFPQDFIASVRVTPGAKASPFCSASKLLGKRGTRQCGSSWDGPQGIQRSRTRERLLKTTLHHVSSFSFSRNCWVPFMFSVLDQKYIFYMGRNMWHRWRGFSDVIYHNFLLCNPKSLVMPSYGYK